MNISGKRGKAVRQGRIHGLLAERGRLAVEDLASDLGVAEMTIRRDLADMERAGVLTRTHGGCVSHAPMVADRSFAEKQSTYEAEKRAIAREVVRRLQPGQSVYLDTGTTAWQVARAMPAGVNLLVFTNNLRVAMELSGRDGVEVQLYGGRLAARSPDLVGESAVLAAGLFRVDLAILGCDAVDEKRGEVYGADLETSALSRQVQRMAARNLFVADHSKVGRRGRAVLGTLGKGVALVTDDRIASGLLKTLKRSGADIIVAKVTSAGQ